MQTFLPYPDMIRSAGCLDYRRLGKQRVETKQILLALMGKSEGWTNHPATLMWEGYDDILATYGSRMCLEWIRRGYKDSLLPFFLGIMAEWEIDPRTPTWPWWWGKPEFHASHRSNLLRKDPVFYGKYGWTEPPDLPYWWPTEQMDSLGLKIV
jgi:hypothetical protein